MSGLLDHLTVVELASAETAWCGRLFSQEGARVILVEPHEGAATRALGPHAAGRTVGLESSLHFWHYNTDKESFVLDIETATGGQALAALLSRADVLLTANGAGASAVEAAANPQLVHIDVTDFSGAGPWRGFAASDLVHLALGGQMMVCGYDDLAATPPLAPTGEQAYHMAATWAFIAALARLQAVPAHGGGRVGVSIHEACAGMTENAFPNYDYLGKVVTRRTGRHASVGPTPPWQHRAKDGRYVNVQLVNVPPNAWAALVEWLSAEGMADDLADDKYFIPELFREHSWHIADVLRPFIATMTADEFFHKAQACGLIVADVNYPEDLVTDEHLAARNFWREVDMGDGTTATFSGSTFLSPEADGGPWRRAPHLDEHGAAIRREFGLA